MELNFEKWEGLGNDFIVVSAEQLDASRAVELAPSLCDRRRGVGADGVLLVAGDPLSMVVINADGSRPEMCGNGLRCAVGLLARQRHWNAGAGELVVETDAGPRRSRWWRTAEGIYDVEIDMGVISFDPADAGVSAIPGASDGSPVAVQSPTFGVGWVASAGNPHWIFLHDERVDLALHGPTHETDPRFTRRTNVEWVRRRGPGHVAVDVWERGCGITEACGTGATAVGSLLVALGEQPVGAPVRVTLPGGDLQITVTEAGTSLMRGPATRVFTGSITI